MKNVNQKIEFLNELKKLLKRTMELYEFTIEFWLKTLVDVGELSPDDVECILAELLEIFDCNCIYTDVTDYADVVELIDSKIKELQTL